MGCLLVAMLVTVWCAFTKPTLAVPIAVAGEPTNPTLTITPLAGNLYFEYFSFNLEEES